MRWKWSVAPTGSDHSGRVCPRGVAVAVLAAVVLVVTIHDVPPERGGPGVTCDELYHISYGKALVASFLRHGPAFFTPSVIRQTFAWRPDGPPVHPPLGNWILGWSHWLFDPAPFEPTRLSVAAARMGVALGFALLVLMVGLFATRRYGVYGGLSAAICLPLLPRLFGHAHLAALDFLTALGCTAAILALCWAARREKWWSFALAGAIWGLALLTRFHALLCLPPAFLWLLLFRRRKAFFPAALWFASGALVFFVGWPWLWLSPLEHLRLYLLTSSTARSHIHAYYCGHVWNDVHIPWHYPWVMFLVTVPVGWLALGFLGICRGWIARRLVPVPSDRPSPSREEMLILFTLVFFLAVFSVPGVPVYDGVRLFLPVFPLWAVLVGRGAAFVWEALPRFTADWRHSIRIGLFWGLIALQGVGVIWFRPAWLSYYNALVGGLAGAARLGFEVNYWGDALTEDLLCRAAEELQPGEVLAFGPSLAPFQGPGMAVGSACLSERQIQVAAWETGSPQPPAGAEWAVFYHRRADLQAIPEPYRDLPPQFEVARQGVWLARLVRLPEAPNSLSKHSVGER